MKKLSILMLLVAIAKLASAQKDSLSFDDHGKYIYYRVVNMGKGDEATLYAKAASFAKTGYDANTLKITGHDDKAGTIDGAGYFTVSKASSLSKHEDGKIAYTVRIEIKEQKYRYWLTGFVFTPYFKDRYNNFVPQQGVDAPVEKFGKDVADKDAAHYLDACGSFARQFGLKLKKYMEAEAAVKKADAKKVITIEKW